MRARSPRDGGGAGDTASASPAPKSARSLPFAVYFVALVAIFAVSAAAAVAYVQVQSDRDARHEARLDAGFAARAAAKELGSDIRLLRTTIGQLASNPGVAQAVVKPKGCALTFSLGSAKGHIDILRLDGAAVCSSRARGKNGQLAGYAGEDWIRAAAASPVFRAPLVDTVTRSPVMLYAAPASGRAIVAGFVDLPSVGTRLSSVYDRSRTAELLVTTRASRTVIARSIRPQRWIGSSVQGTSFIREAGKTDRADLDGNRRIYASATVAGTNWELFVGEDESDALAAGRRLRNRELAIVLSTLALVLLATLFVYRRVVVPMKQLSDGVRSTAARGVYTPVTVSGPAEVTALANEVNALTASVNAHEEVRRAKEEAERANEAKSLFLSHMSHELRTPLSAILGFAEILRRHTADEEEREWAGHILRGGEHLLALVNELLDISRIEAGRVTLAIEPVEVGQTVDEVLALAEPLAAERGIRLEQAHAEASGRRALVDPLRLKQVLLNLVSNAIKYNREGGAVRISIAEAERGTMRVTVTDTGAGIAPDDLEKLFSPFERLGAGRGTVEGSGLGLVVAKGLVEAMDGRLDVESEVGTGTSFAIELPLEAVAAAEERPRAPAPAASHASSGDLLYIEDNPVNLQIVESILSDLRPGLALRTATKGTDGAELAEERRPDLLLLDLNLPDISGEEVLRRLRARVETADVPVLILSADSTSRNITRLLATGADAYLTKPLDVDQFLDVFDRLLQTR